MSLAVLLAQVDTSVVNLAMRSIGADLHGSVISLQWVLDAYNLTYASPDTWPKGLALAQ